MKRTLLATLLPLALAAPALSSQQFTATDLGVLPGHDESRAWGMNDAGQIVGWSRAGSSLRAVLFDPSTGLSEVGVLAGATNSSARGINNWGEVVGSSWGAPITQPGRPFLRLTNGVLVDLGSLPGGNTGEAFDVNDAGVVVGMAQGTGFSPEPFRATVAGSLTALTQGQAGNAYAVNIATTIAGDANGRAVLWEGSGATIQLAQDPNFPRSRAQAVNGVGVAAGIQEDASGTTARLVIWTGGGIEDLGIIGRYSQVTSISDAGWIVGYDQFSFQVRPRAFLHTPSGGRQFVDSLLLSNPEGWAITSVFAVNARGQMAANAVNAQGDRRALRLDPVGGTGPSAVTRFCSGSENSTGAVASLTAMNIDIVANSMTLASSNLPTQSFGLSLVSLERGYTVAPGGSFGDLCLGGAIGRAVGGALLNSGANGTWSELVDLQSIPQANGTVQVLAGETWFFQAWYRDQSGNLAGSNFTDGLRVIF